MALLASHLMVQLWANEEGLTTVEYAILLALLTLGSIGAWEALGNTHLQNTVGAVSHYVEAGSTS